MNESLPELLDIFLITYNRSAALDRTLTQILDESSPIKDFEIKIIDNDSTDDTFSIVQKWQKSHPNLKYSKNKHNIGGNANIVKAYYKAQKKYVWVLCDDDKYQWDSWSEVVNAIMDDENAIVVCRMDEPQMNIVQLFAQTCFVPGVIYKTSLFDTDVFENMTYGISNMFPHMAISAKLINENIPFKIISKEIVMYQLPEETLERSYVRGTTSKNLHPFRENRSYWAGYANASMLIKDKKLRNEILTKRRFYNPVVNSLDLFDSNDCNCNGSFYNLVSIFLALSFWQRITFVLRFFIYKIIGKIFFIYKREYIDKKNRTVSIYYNMKILSMIKTKIFNYVRKGEI